ncbi:glycosyl-4,4'-diaponeurosporenoate acyltransferase CrtO family protein [Pontibacter lucknowensis]|uniref:Glycosyl-4,4'-diaponeurosporenoate acyltransferase n=1 Tax=Pontibacter lucknowensis TaxID=1077936 RepID=A0A1N6Y2Z0_9BACT|nr:hypothetical protein [Pontibacter lucknowensis]SIR08913.1 hypothetical protein SAMN05421545_2228 [Pontibacter lucknowensis]
MFKYLSTFFILLFATGSILVVAYLLGVSSFSFAWVLNFLLMMGVSSLMQTFKPKLTAAYFDGKNWERNGRVYSWLGVNTFRKILVWVGWEKLHKAANPVKKDLQALKKLEYNTRQSEFGHLVIFFIVLASAAWVALYYGIKQSLWLMSLNVILNLYPILVQRYNRPRLQRAIKVRELSPSANVGAMQ